MMKKTVLFLLLCMAAAPGLSQTLTLDECRAAAEEHNRTLKTSRLDLDAALQARREAFTTYFPQVSASGGVFQAQHGLVQADFAIPQMGSLPLSLVKRGILGSVTAVQPLFAGLKIVSATSSPGWAKRSHSCNCKRPRPRCANVPTPISGRWYRSGTTFRLSKPWSGNWRRYTARSHSRSRRGS